MSVRVGCELWRGTARADSQLGARDPIDELAHREWQRSVPRATRHAVALVLREL
jgi:hypothetical protein